MIETANQSQRTFAHDTQPYDSTADTLTHIRRVNELILGMCQELIGRAVVHDESKLHDPEKSAFDTYTPRLRGLTYGSDEYRACLREMKTAIHHHQRNNRHHPEYFENSVDGMSLIDLLEMICDWKAATERHEDGDIFKSLEINKDRFGIGHQLGDILANTVKEFFDKPKEPDA